MQATANVTARLVIERPGDEPLVLDLHEPTLLGGGPVPAGSVVKQLSEWASSSSSDPPPGTAVLARPAPEHGDVRSAPENGDVRRSPEHGDFRLSPEHREALPGLPPDVLAALPCRGGGVVLEARADGRLVVEGAALPKGVRRLLRAGERATIGGFALRVEEEEPPGDTRALGGALLAGARPGPSSPHQLVVVEGPSAGERFTIQDGAVLGRAGAADLRLDDPALSRRHARVVFREETALLVDLGSKNGLAVNGKRHRRSRVRLRDGDLVKLGDTLLSYGASGRSAGAPRAAEPILAQRTPPPKSRPPVSLSATAWVALASGALAAASLAALVAL